MSRGALSAGALSAGALSSVGNFIALAVVIPAGPLDDRVGGCGVGRLAGGIDHCLIRLVVAAEPFDIHGVGKGIYRLAGQFDGHAVVGGTIGVRRHGLRGPGGECLGPGVTEIEGSHREGASESSGRRGRLLDHLGTGLHRNRWKGHDLLDAPLGRPLVGERDDLFPRRDEGSRGPRGKLERLPFGVHGRHDRVGCLVVAGPRVDVHDLAGEVEAVPVAHQPRIGGIGIPAGIGLFLHRHRRDLEGPHRVGQGQVY